MAKAKAGAKAKRAPKRPPEADRRGPARETLLSLFRTMLTIRAVEERLVRSHAAGLVHGACHTYIGEEAVASGVCAHLRPEDLVFGTHRGHGHALGKGATPEELVAELYGRVTGISGGRGGSMHLFKPEIGLMGTNGIVGAGIGLAAGAACAFQLARSDRVSVAFFGDGAVANGIFHEAINLAGLWSLPALFVCENNGYATEVPFRATSRSPSAAARARAYGVEAVEVDGNDVVEVWRRAGEAIRRARGGDGPTLLECATYRTRPHAEGMREGGYRSREEVEAWKKKCPIDRLGRSLLASRTATEAELDSIRAEVARLVSEAHDRAVAAPWPEPGTLLEHVGSLSAGVRRA
jgi:2-oxoisovalerate dehydrogenase E1 component